jgi:lysophospholipase L1-like esterase
MVGRHLATLFLFIGASAFTSPAAQAADRLLVFGDSYSALNRRDFPNWAEQLKASGDVNRLESYARSGATAKDGGNSFASQVRRWRSGGSQPDGNDATAVFFGINDIIKNGSLSAARADYAGSVQALIDGGAVADGGQLLLLMPHDMGSTPRFNRSAASRSKYRSRTRTWNGYVASTARQHSNTVTVDVFSLIEKVLANPGRYGLSNVTTADPKRSATTALYDDELHFGRKGQSLIRQAVAGRLQRGASAAAGLALRRQTRAGQLRAAEASLAVGQALMDETGLGLVALPLQTAALDPPPPAGDPSRAGFAAAFAPAEDSGLALRYALSPTTAFSLVIADSSDSTAVTAERETLRSDLASHTVELRLEERLGRLALETRFSHVREAHTTARYDSITQSHDRAEHEGRSLELAQRAGLPLTRGGITVTPWAELAYARHSLDGFTLTSPFTADQHYAGDTVSDAEARLGLDLSLAPIRLGEAAVLELHTSLAYHHGLIRDDYRLKVEESAFGNVQEETIARPPARTLAVGVGASLSLGPSLALDGDLLLAHDPGLESEQAARMALTWRF